MCKGQLYSLLLVKKNTGTPIQCSEKVHNMFWFLGSSSSPCQVQPQPVLPCRGWCQCVHSDPVSTGKEAQTCNKDCGTNIQP